MIRAALPSSALLRKYLDAGGYVDCYATVVMQDISLAQYVEAFYTTRLFKLERLILKWLVRKPSSDADAKHLAHGKAGAFAAWTVEARASDQLLLCDFRHRTRSWLMVAPLGGGPGTRLYFGSAVVPVRSRSGEAKLGFLFAALLGFHKLYSRMLLQAATVRLS